MATDLSSSSTVCSLGDADRFLRRVIQFPLQLRNGWLPKQFHYSCALILLSVSRLPGANCDALLVDGAHVGRPDLGDAALEGSCEMRVEYDAGCGLAHLAHGVGLEHLKAIARP
jgi:hypothetical protein